MEIKVRVYLDNRMFEPSELHKITIKSVTIDRIINDVVDRNLQKEGSADALKQVS